MSLTPAEQAKLISDYKFLAGAFRKQKKQLDDLSSVTEQLKGVIEQAGAAPAYIDQIPGRRVPYLHRVELLVAANSTARIEGRANITQDGPFVITGIMLLFERTAGPYNSKYYAATTIDLKMAEAVMSLGFQGLFNNPVGFDADIQITDTASDRGWQNIAFPSAICNAENAYTYMLPLSYLADQNTTVNIAATPKFTQDFAGTLHVMLLGYKIVQGASYQP